MDACGNRLLLADVLQAFDAYSCDLQQESGVLAEYVDGLGSLAHLAMRAIVSVGTIGQATADIGIGLTHP
ncbi:hypothetical protein A6723_010855 [Pseudomonas sp. AU11447]|nr:hypothetical protein A6723_010855 [Pseudomonas sp. AU11447]